MHTTSWGNVPGLRSSAQGMFSKMSYKIFMSMIHSHHAQQLAYVCKVTREIPLDRIPKSINNHYAPPC